MTPEELAVVEAGQAWDRWVRAEKALRAATADADEAWARWVAAGRAILEGQG